MMNPMRPALQARGLTKVYAQAEAAMEALGARGHVTFGGRLTEEARGWLGFVARRMAHEGHGGDFRNPERIRAWARDIAEEIRAQRQVT